ncbi:MAG: 4Fe-4S binding protein [Candidatus Lokiarchaeota archaeon]|nr:4Fe-4S binding protein [Candidatus Lokiarchaeota archaeon]
MELFQYLPQTNCKKCGKLTCMAFSLELLKGNVNIEECTPLLDESKYQNKYSKLKELLKGEEGQKRELKIGIDIVKCDGCGICVTICPVNARYCYSILSGKVADYPPDKHQLFMVKEGKCELLSIENCRRLVTEGKERECRVCETYCPRVAIKIEYI